ncbi:MAG: alpha/beta hydrolase [Acidothermaceae bacterium]
MKAFRAALSIGLITTGVLTVGASASATPLLVTGESTVVSTADGPAPAVTHATGTLADGATWIADLPSNWNGTLLLFSHGYGPPVAADSPDQAGAKAALLNRGYALVGSSYDPNGSWWALDSAVGDQFQAMDAMESGVLPHQPRQVLAVGESMGGLISALEAQDGAGRIDGALTTCGIVAGGINLNNYQLDGEYTLAKLLLPGQPVQLVGFQGAGDASPTVAALSAAAAAAQQTASGRARLALAMAFINVPSWSSEQNPPPPVNDPVAQEAGQYAVEFSDLFAIPGVFPNTLGFIEGSRYSLNQADGGGIATWTRGVDFASLLRNSPYENEVEKLYRKAGLNLRDDLATLTTNADIAADPAAVYSLKETSVPTGHLDVPELDMHTVADQLVPVQQESFYAEQVRRAGSGELLRQAYVASVGHCNFSPAELVAGVQAVSQRIASGHWGSVAEPKKLEQVATGLNLGAARFVQFHPGNLTGVNGPYNPAKN